MISVKNISKAFDGNQVLKNISITFEPGKTNLIIGRSGSGKTVLLKSILGLFDIDEGEIWYNDRNLVKMSNKERKLLRSEIGMVFQGGALFDSVSVEGNVRFPLDMFTNMSGPEKIKRVQFCLDHVNIDRVITSYSIHYTKLYELTPAPTAERWPLRTAVRAS